MNHSYSASSSHQPAPAHNRVGVVEATVIICLAIGLLAISVPLIELMAVWIPQLTLLALFSATLALLDPRVTGTAPRAAVATGAALLFAVVGILSALAVGYSLLVTENSLIFTLPYAIGAGLAGGTWVARPGTRFSRILMRAFEGTATTIVLYGAVGMTLVLIRS